MTKYTFRGREMVFKDEIVLIEDSGSSSALDEGLDTNADLKNSLNLILGHLYCGRAGLSIMKLDDVEKKLQDSIEETEKILSGIGD